MSFSSRASFWALYACVPCVLAQATYGNNLLEAAKDSDIVAAAFPDVEGVDLIAPAFTSPETVPSGFENGTSGPTDLFELGEYYDIPPDTFCILLISSRLLHQVHRKPE